MAKAKAKVSKRDPEKVKRVDELLAANFSTKDIVSLMQSEGKPITANYVYSRKTDLKHRAGGPAKTPKEVHNLLLEKVAGKQVKPPKMMPSHLKKADTVTSVTLDTPAAVWTASVGPAEPDVSPFEELIQLRIENAQLRQDNQKFRNVIADLL